MSRYVVMQEGQNLLNKVFVEQFALIPPTDNYPRYVFPSIHELTGPRQAIGVADSFACIDGDVSAVIRLFGNESLPENWAYSADLRDADVKRISTDGRAIIRKASIGHIYMTPNVPWSDRGPMVDRIGSQYLPWVRS